MLVPEFAAAQEAPDLAGSPPAAASAEAAPQNDRAAADPLAAQKQRARELGWSGVDLFKAEKFGEASKKFEEAYTIQRVPTIGLWSARALREQGKWVEASERYVEILLMPRDPAAPEVYRAAVQDAERENDELKPRIPLLSLTLAAGAQDRTRIDINGTPFDIKRLGSRVPFNPGRLKVVAKQGLQTVTYAVLLSEGASETLNIVFTPPAKPPARTAPPPAPAAAPPSYALDSSPAPREGTPASVWAGLAIGGVGLTAGILFGLSAQNQRDELRPLCPNNACDREHASKLDDFNQARITSLVGYGVGVGASILAGVLYWQAAPSPQTALRLSPSGATLEGTF